MVVVDDQDGVGIGTLYLRAQREHGVAALLHILFVLLALGRPREQLKVRVRGRDGTNQRHHDLP